MASRGTESPVPWRQIALGTTVIGTISAASGALQRRLEQESVSVVPLLATALPQWWFWAFVAPLVFWLERRLTSGGAPRPRRIAVHLVVALLSALVHTVMMVAISRAAYPPVSAEDTWGRWLTSFFASRIILDILIYGALLAIAQVVDARARLAHERRAAIELEAELTRARLEVLQIQLQPHFLFNTLHAVGVLTQEDPAKATRMIAALGDLLRRSLASRSSQEVPLEEELILLDHYLEIELTRFPDRLRVTREIDSGLERLLVPTFLLQPLVENAVRYGVAPRSGVGQVTIRARRHDGKLELAVWNDGSTLESGRAGGIGLATTESRLERLYGNDGRLELRTVVTPFPGVEAVVTLPAHDRPVV